MKKTISFIAMFLACLMLIGSLGACAEKPVSSNGTSSVASADSTADSENTGELGEYTSGDESYTFRVIVQQAEDSVQSEGYEVKQALDEYISSYRPNWNYEFETIPKLEVASKISILISSNDVPDFFVYEDGKMLDDIIKLDAIINLEEDIKKIGLTIEDFMLPSAIQSKRLTSSYDTIYSLPTSFSLNMLFYNKKIFADNGIEIPKTWDDYEAICDTLQNKGIQPMAFAGAEGWLCGWFLNNYTARFISPQFHLDAAVNENGATFRDPEFVEAVQHCQDFFQKGYAGEGFLSVDLANMYQIFLTGQAAMMLASADSVAYLSDPDQCEIGEENIGLIHWGNIEGRPVTYDEAIATDELACGVAMCIGKSQWAEGTNNEFFHYLLTSWGDRMISNRKYSTPYVSTVEIDKDSLSPTQQLVIEKLETVKTPTLWFEGKMSADGTLASQTNIQLVYEGTMTAQDYAEELAEITDREHPINE